MRKSRELLSGAFLDQDDLESGRRQDLRRDAAAGAGADDRDVGIEREVAVEAAASMTFQPAASPSRIGSRITSTSGGPG